MKKIVLALLVSVFSLGASAQTVPPVKGANTIIIQTTDSASAALKKMARYFVTRGYTIDKIDSELGYFTTAAMRFANNTPASYRLKVVASESNPAKLSLTGSYAHASRYGSTSEYMVFEEKQTYRRYTFLLADEAAKLYTGGVLSYEVH